MKIYAKAGAEWCPLIALDSQREAMEWADAALLAIAGESLIGELNDIQAECNLDKDPKPFPDKFAMPLCIVNLVLKEFNLELREG